jgi:hypothetical protein
MRRVFWITLGATIGVLVVRKIARIADNLAPEGAANRITEQARGLTQVIREFTADVKVGMAERDAQLRDALGFADSTADRDTELPGQPDPAAVDDLVHTHPRGTY